MSDFVPVNGLELALRAVLQDKNTPLWSFYTPLAAAPLWIIARHYPELDGSDLVAPEGKSPELCTFTGPKGTYIGLYTAACRAQAAMKRWNISPQAMTCISAKGYPLLQFLSTLDSDIYVNFGLPECQYGLDPDMVEILLSRPEPEGAMEAPRDVVVRPEVDPVPYLGPVEFLQHQSTVRAAWVFGTAPGPDLPDGHQACELCLLMADPEDKSLLREVEVMAKALTPVEMEWTTSVMMSDDESLRRLAEKQAPFYEKPEFRGRKTVG